VRCSLPGGLALFGVLVLGGAATAQQKVGPKTAQGAHAVKGGRRRAPEGAGKPSKGAEEMKGKLRRGAMPWRAALAGHQWRNALPGLRRELANNPDDPDLHAQYAIASARVGRFADAYAAFALSLGSTVYEAKGLGMHADTLRATGHLDEAIELRQEAIAASTNEMQRFGLLFDLVDDYRYAGDLGSAQDTADELLSIAPGIDEVYSIAADVALDAGDLDDAAFDLWLADLDGSRTARTRSARARLQIAYGDLEAAYGEVAYGRMKNRNHMPWAIQAEILRRQGMPDQGVILLESARLPDKDRPEMMAALLACLSSAGELAEARDLRDEATALYPKDPDVIAAAKVYDLAVAAKR